MSTATQYALVVAAVGSGLVGGVFFAFSTFVMPALRQVPAADGIRSMQAMNRTALGPGLMTALFGTAVVAVGVAVWAFRHLRSGAAPWTIAGAALYVVSAVLVTAAANVPRNDALAKLDAGGNGAAQQWADFLSGWTTWNHVRTVGCLAAAIAFTVAALRAED